MDKSNQRSVWAWTIVVLVIVIDQLTKILVKLNFSLHESVEVTSWFHIAFVENNGMAYGMELFNKYFLTIFRIVAVAAFGYILWKSVKQKCSYGFVIFLALVVSGACGNIFDCVFYGRLFTDSYGHVAKWATDGLEGYAPWFNGRVVDMLHFPLIHFYWPAWVPESGELMNWCGWQFRWPSWMPCSDEAFLFFSPVFNVADAAISVGTVSMVLFYRKTFSKLVS